jgi:diguanylate cyclase (GGDEF)-like protein
VASPVSLHGRNFLSSLRFRVGVAMLGIAIVCVYIGTSETSSEVRGAYRDSALKSLQAATKGLDGQTPRELVRSHPDLQSAAIYRGNRGAASSSAGEPAALADEHRLAVQAIRTGKPVGARQPDAEVLASPLPGGRALVVAYDMRPAEHQLDARSNRIELIALTLAGFALLLVVFVVARAVFRPLDRLRAAARAFGEGDLSTRLGWSRRDELGQLASEFDTMAARLEEHQRGLQDLVHRDPLTDLPNHRRFHEALGQTLAESRAPGRRFAVVLLDVDDFKRINDTHGHPYGDELLGGAARALKAAVGERATAARVGGDEFGIVVPDVGGRGAFEVAEAARLAVEQSAPVQGALRCSAGLACYPDDAKSAGTLLQLAGGALAWAKDSGRGRARRYDPEHVFAITAEQREDFAATIGRPDAIRTVFQPIVGLSSGEAVGYEALARFDDKPGLPPTWWFQQAHRFGLGAALEAQSVRAALAPDNRPAGTFLSINLSPSALASREVSEALPEDLDGLVIEITEEERVLDVEALQRHLDPLRARGARIAVDDAGEGYAGLQQVMSMRADIIKLDRALVADVSADPAKVALIGSLVHFARSTGAAICAEGIETLQELRVLVHLGVAYGQGWALARPDAPWPRVNAEAAELCRDLRSAHNKVVPIGAHDELRKGA